MRGAGLRFCLFVLSLVTALLFPGTASAAPATCILLSTGPGGPVTCCDNDGDYFTESCADGNDYFLLDAWCSDNGELCTPDPDRCSLYQESGGGLAYACISEPDCSDEDPERFPDDPFVDSEELCDGKDNDCTGAIDEPFDLDQDFVTDDCGGGSGYYVGLPAGDCDPLTGDVSSQPACLVVADCDDTRADVYPANPADPDGAPEVCDGNGTDEDCDGISDGQEVCDADNVDEDCDGVADNDDSSTLPESKSAFYPDVDQDGYGDRDAPSAQACDPFIIGSGVRYVGEGTDCDDSSRAVHPGAEEVCDPNDVDEDCDDQADNGDSSTLPASQTRYYPDADRDTYGDRSSPGALYCDDPSSTAQRFSVDHTDCADQNADINPAAQEVCDPLQADEDCDDLADDLDSSAADSSKQTWYPDADRDSYGDASSAGERYCRDPSSTADAYARDHTDCDDISAAVKPGALEQCDALDNDCDGLTDEGFDQDTDGATICGPDGKAGTSDDDCEDANPDNFPGNFETCDGEDNDCDREADDGFDQDADEVTTCGRDGNLETTSDNDCDDLDPGKFPGNVEKCDGIDQNCNGQIDDGAASNALEFWIDQDNDGYGSDASVVLGCAQPQGYVLEPTDPEDEDCNDLDPSVFPGAQNERLDGFDTNCDGRIPVVELDCDNDGQYPISRLMLAGLQLGVLPADRIEVSCTDKRELLGIELGVPNPSGLINDALYDAASVGLEPCQHGDIPPSVSCLGLTTPDDFTVLCDDPAEGGTGFWLVADYDVVKPRFDEGRRNNPTQKCDSDFADCDDQAAAVCGCQAELCDGIDTNCARDGVNRLDVLSLDLYDDNGLPDPMQAQAPRTGFVASKELDADADGVLTCTELESLDTFKDDLFAWSSEGLPARWKYEDCDDDCALKNQDAEELCDGIVDNACESVRTGVAEDPNAEGEGTAAFCGYLSGDGSNQSDVTYVLVYDRCPGCPVNDGPRYLPLTRVRETLARPRFDAQEGTGCEGDQPDCVESDPAASLIERELERVDAQLSTIRNGRLCLPPRLERVEAADDPSLELLRLCLPGRDEMPASATPRCRLTRIELSPDTNEVIREEFGKLTSSTSELCSSSYTTRTLWPADRIRSARDVLGLWQCIQSGQCLCQGEDGTLGPVYNDCTRVVAAPRDTFTRVAYVRTNDLIGELDRTIFPVDVGAFLDSSFVGMPGWAHGCWGSGSLVGGACDDGTRDTVEGPRDIYGRLTGDVGECSSCTDGLDNNCNGLRDEEDPGCYPCYQAQGVSCGGCGGGEVPDPGSVAASMLVLGVPLVVRLRRARRGGRP